MSTILVTGIAGFVGSHLVDLLLQNSITNIIGILHPSHAIQHLEKSPRIRVYYEDITRENRLPMLIQEVQPQTIYHLAGLAHVHESWTNRQETIETNFMGAFHLLEACRTLAVFPKVLLVGSAECYGVVPEEQQPISESQPFSPTSPYAVSKIAQEMLGIQYARGERLPVYLSRSFNHMGPRQKETFVCSAFAHQIAQAELGLTDPEIKVGNLVARRDFTDVRDVVRAYQAILERGIPGEPYNVCSGSAASIEEVLQILLSFSRRSLRVVADAGKFRPVDMPLLLGNPEKLHRQTGWTPFYNIRSTLGDLLDYWRVKVKPYENSKPIG